MVDQDELNRITRYIRGFITGRREDFDVIDLRALDALRRRSLASVLSEYHEEDLQVRGVDGNTTRDAMALMESIREDLGLSLNELSRRSGISRGHVGALLSNSAKNPTLESLVRLSIALECPIELVDLPAPEQSATSSTEDSKEPSLWQSVRGVAGPTLLGLGMLAGIAALFRSIGEDAKTTTKSKSKSKTKKGKK